jgi:hypothetical protein
MSQNSAINHPGTRFVGGVNGALGARVPAWPPREEMRAHSDRIITGAVFALDELALDKAD